MKEILFVVFVTIFACPLSASGMERLPNEVQASVDEAKSDCKEGVTLDKGFMTKKDINGDGVDDFILDFGRFQCGTSPSIYCGSAGCATTVFASISGGRYKKVLDENVRGLDFKKIGNRPAMILELHGSSCGKIGAAACNATLFWDGEKFSRSARTAKTPAADLDVPVIEHGGDGQASNCWSSVVRGLTVGQNGFLAVRSGPGTQFRKLSELHNGDVVIVFEMKGLWSGVAYGSLSAVTCSSPKSHPIAYREKGWVLSRALKDVAY